MILKRYGKSFESVDPNFESKALNEIGFRRDRELVLPAEEFEVRYELETRHELRASAEGPVQDHTRRAWSRTVCSSWRTRRGWTTRRPVRPPETSW